MCPLRRPHARAHPNAGVVGHGSERVRQHRRWLACRWTFPSTQPRGGGSRCRRLRPGSIGLSAVATAVAEGASRVVYLDADARRNGIAAIQGAHVVAAEPWPRRLGPFPITVDACGTPEALSLAIRSTAPNGNCTSTTIYFDNRGELPLLEMFEKVITFKTGRTHARPHIPGVLSLLESGSLAADAVTTRKVDWADAPAALVERDWVKLVIERPALISN